MNTTVGRFSVLAKANIASSIHLTPLVGLRVHLAVEEAERERRLVDARLDSQLVEAIDGPMVAQLDVAHTIVVKARDQALRLAPVQNAIAVRRNSAFARRVELVRVDVVLVGGLECDSRLRKVPEGLARGHDLVELVVVHDGLVVDAAVVALAKARDLLLDLFLVVLDEKVEIAEPEARVESIRSVLVSPRQLNEVLMAATSRLVSALQAAWQLDAGDCGPVG